MEISNNQSWYVNSNTRQVTSNIKNTAIKDREAFNGSMQNLLNPVEDLVQVLKTPIKLAERSSLNRQRNSVDIASGSRIAVNDGYILTVKPQGVEVSGGNDDIFGDDLESNIAAVKKIMERSENPLSVVSERNAEFVADEKTFYAALLNNLT